MHPVAMGNINVSSAYMHAREGIISANYKAESQVTSVHLLCLLPLVGIPQLNRRTL